MARGWDGVALAPLKEVPAGAANFRPMILDSHVHLKHGDADPCRSIVPPQWSDCMTSRQRLLTALRCGQPDRVPVTIFINPHDPTDACTADPSYAPVLDAMNRYADVSWSWHVPLGFLLTGTPIEVGQRGLPDGSTEYTVATPAGPLTSVHRAGARGELKRWIAEPADIDKWLSLPYVPPAMDWSAVEQAQAEHGEAITTQAVMLDPACCTGFIAEEEVAIWTVRERGLLRSYYDECFRRIMDQVREVCRSPVDVIYFNGPEYCIPPLMSPRDFEEFVSHYDRQLFTYIRENGCAADASDKLILVHSHGKVWQFLEAFRDMGLHGLNVLEPPPMGDVDLAAAKRLIGDEVCLIGNIQYDELARGSLELVESLVREAMAAGKPGGGFILCPCAAPYEHPLPERAARNLVRYLELGHELGEY